MGDEMVRLRCWPVFIAGVGGRPKLDAPMERPSGREERPLIRCRTVFIE